MPTVDGNAAAQTLLGYKTCDPGYCLHYVWEAYAAHGASSSESYPTAYSAWEGSSGKHEGDWNPPSGVPVYFGPRSGSSAGDVVISMGGGKCAATDYSYNGVIHETTLKDRQAQIGRPYLGWCDNMLGNPIKQVQPKPEEDDMPGLQYLKVDRTHPQELVGGTAERVVFDDGGRVSLYTGPHKVIDGDLFIQIDVTKRPEESDYGKGHPWTMQPVLEAIDSHNNVTNTHSLGMMEFPMTTGKVYAHIQYPPIQLSSDHRPRVMVALPSGFEGYIAAGAFRGRYWD